MLKLSKDEIKGWVDRWSRLQPTPRRDMVIKMWSRFL